MKRDFPRWKYHATEPAVIVENPQAEADLGEEWIALPDLQRAFRSATSAFQTLIIASASWCGGRVGW